MNSKIEDKISFEELAKAYPKLNSLAKKFPYLREGVAVAGKMHKRSSAYRFSSCKTTFKDDKLEWHVLNPNVLHFDDIDTVQYSGFALFRGFFREQREIVHKASSVLLVLGTLYWLKREHVQILQIEFSDIGPRGVIQLTRFLGFGAGKEAEDNMKSFFREKGQYYRLYGATMPFKDFEQRVNQEWSKKE